MQQQGMPPGQMPEQSAGDDGGKTLAYCVELYVYTDGTYRVSKEDAGQEEAEHEATGTQEGKDGTDFDKLGDALGAILDMVKANPAGGDANAQLEAGYNSREQPTAMPMGGR